MTEPSPTAASTPAERLHELIAERGPINFAEFMEVALYDPDHGFYALPPVGEKGHFVTSPHISPVFGTLLAQQIEEFWELLDEPEPFSIVEVGAGDGTLLRQLLDHMSPLVLKSGRPVAVERSAGARKALEDLGVSVAASLEELGPVGPGCILANELLDNLPFHRVRMTESGLRELYVSSEPGGFRLIEGDVSSEDVSSIAPELRPGREGVVSVQAVDFVDRAAATIDRGYVWIVDYGSRAGGGHSSPHGYRGHRVEPDVLASPGSRDITAGVDFGALIRRAEALGLSVWGPVTQRDALFALGFRDLDAEARARQVELAAQGRGIEAARAYSDRGRASILVDPTGPGGFLVLCLGIGTDAAPTSVRSG
jgi:SAM-dependent MidA family methyltransferase